MAKTISGSDRRRRGEVITFRALPEEAEAIRAAADRAALSIGAFLRAAGTGSAGPRAVRRPVVEKAALARILGKLGAIATDVRALRAAAERTGDVDAERMASVIGDALYEMRNALFAALGRQG